MTFAAISRTRQASSARDATTDLAAASSQSQNKPRNAQTRNQ